MTDYTPEQLASHIFAGLPEDLLEHRRDDLVARCRAVRADGWDKGPRRSNAPGLPDSSRLVKASRCPIRSCQ